ncbi:unnamed protein product [Plutella xylostella]|uniref:(diamondback moth) hypothetical protein n=1 Tax=Plutella xylostella TaxID=51655 RepID=A0A8S4F4T9_PLUXY|nr:unnamed protein product [Plutella xylostella]
MIYKSREEVTDDSYGSRVLLMKMSATAALLFCSLLGVISPQIPDFKPGDRKIITGPFWHEVFTETYEDHDDDVSTTTSEPLPFFEDDASTNNVTAQLGSHVHLHCRVHDLGEKTLGFGTKGGCEAAVHAARSFLQHGGGEVLLKVDVANAFNSVDRGALLTEIKDHIPDIFHYMWQCYSKPTKLIYKNNLLQSAVGCQQGDPLGPAIFSLAIHPHISSLASKFNVWYLDDGTLGGEANTVLSDLQNIINKFDSIGLNLNFSKCELFVSERIPPGEKEQIINKFNSLAPNIKLINKNLLRLLGAPVLDDSVESFTTEKITKFEESSKKLKELSPHMAYCIIKYCLFVPKFNYVLRCTTLWKHKILLNTLDDLVRKTLVEILNCPLNDKSWMQATLPIRFGGTGIRSVSAVALPAFLSSAHSTSDLYGKIIYPSLGDVEVTCLAEARNAWLDVTGRSQSLPIVPGSQRLWDEPLCTQVQKNLTDSAQNPAERARLMAAVEPESGYWLHALPSTILGTHLDRSTFSLAISLRIGAKINEPHRCRCGGGVDELGHHGLACQRSAGRLSRHAALNDVIRRALASAGVPAVLEPTGVARDDGKRPDGMTLIPWKNGRPLVWDATCVDTLAQSHLPATATKAGAAAATAEAAKRRKYAALGQGYMFVPFGVETLGPWGPDAKRIYREIATRLIDASGDQRAGTYLGQRISLAIQRGNAASLLGTLPNDGGDLENIFYLLR